MANIGNKYRVHEVAKDFGVPTKQITEILTKYAETPKNHMQVLGDRELSLIFEYLTQHNQVSGIQVIFAEGMKTEEKKAAEPAKPQSAAPAKQDGSKSAGKAPAPQQGTAPAKQEPKPARQESKPVSRVPQTKVVDTRKATNVNLAKYDEKLQDMAEGRNARTGGSKRRDQQVQGKEKFRNNKQRQQGNLAPTSAARKRLTGCAASSWKSSRRPPSPCRSPTRSAWASWPAA